MINFSKTLTTAIAAMALIGSPDSHAAITKIELNQYGGLGPDPFADNAPWGIISTESLLPDSGAFAIGTAYPGNPDYQNSIVFSYESFDYSRWIYITFSTDSTGMPLGIGIFENAERFPFNTPGLPGIDYVDTGFGLNTLTGKFEITSLEKDFDNQVASFSATFFINDFPAPTGEYLISGNLFFNVADSSSQIPEPGSGSLFVISGIGIALTQIRRKSEARNQGNSFFIEG